MKILTDSQTRKSPKEEDIDESEWLRAASANPAFAFLEDPEEDIYSMYWDLGI